MLSHGSPAAIIRAISFVIVDSVNGQVILVAVSHCPIIERLEIICPLSANRNSTPTIVRIMFVFLVAATGFHVNPDGVQSGMIFSANCLLFASNLSTKATATLSMAATKMGSTNDNAFSAVTLTKPLSFLRIAIFGPLNHHQPPETLGGQIDSFPCCASLSCRHCR